MATPIPFPRTVSTVVKELKSNLLQYIILAVLAWIGWSFSRWMDEAIAKSPSVALANTAAVNANVAASAASVAAKDAKDTAVVARAAVVEANSVAVDAKTAAAAAVVKSDAIAIGQEKISGFLQRNIEEQKSTRDTLARFDTHLQVVEVKVEEGAKLTASEISNLKEQVRTLQK